MPPRNTIQVSIITIKFMPNSGHNFTTKVSSAMRKIYAPMRKYLTRKQDIGTGPNTAGLLQCKSCGIYYFAKGWHALRPEGTTGFEITQVTCPADEMREKGEYEGSVKMMNIPEEYKQEIANLVDNMEKHAYAQDPLHRVLSYEDKGEVVEIYTSENQLAQKIARKINDTYKNAFAESQVDRGDKTNTIDVELDWIKTE
jgi:hypothetical protein